MDINKVIAFVLVFGSAGLIVSSSLMSCSPKIEARIKKDHINDSWSSLSYYKDPRTSLCFAYVSSDTYGLEQVVSIATVPCGALKNVKLSK